MAKAAYSPYYSNSWAVIVGINDYKYAGPLTYAIHDAEAIAELLVSHLNFEEERVHLLLNDDATRPNILGVLSGIEDEPGAAHDDRVLFFYAGHGYTIDGARGPIGFLVPIEGDPTNMGTLISFDDLVRTSEILSAKHVLLVMDACYGGVILRRTTQPGTQRFLSDMLQRYSRQVITAGRADETVADGGGPRGQNSIFTGHLLKGATGKAMTPDGVLTANALMQFVYESVSRDPKSEQSPYFGYLDGDGDFILQTPNGEHLGTNIKEDFEIAVPEAIAEFEEPEVGVQEHPPSKPAPPSNQLREEFEAIWPAFLETLEDDLREGEASAELARKRAKDPKPHPGIEIHSPSVATQFTVYHQNTISNYDKELGEFLSRFLRASDKLRLSANTYNQLIYADLLEDLTFEQTDRLEGQSDFRIARDDMYEKSRTLEAAIDDLRLKLRYYSDLKTS